MPTRQKSLKRFAFFGMDKVNKMINNLAYFKFENFGQKSKKNRRIRQSLIRLFMVLGTLYTLWNVKECIKKYTRYQSTIHEQKGQSDGNFSTVLFF